RERREEGAGDPFERGEIGFRAGAEPAFEVLPGQLVAGAGEPGETRALGVVEAAGAAIDGTDPTLRVGHADLGGRGFAHGAPGALDLGGEGGERIVDALAGAGEVEARIREGLVREHVAARDDLGAGGSRNGEEREGRDERHDARGEAKWGSRRRHAISPFHGPRSRPAIRSPEVSGGRWEP